jgi:hypothetical protein
MAPVSDYRDGIGWAHYGGPDDFEAERRAMIQREQHRLSGQQALVRLQEQRMQFDDEDEDDVEIRHSWRP